MIYQFSLSAQKEYYPVHKKRGIQYFLSGNARMIEGIFYLFFLLNGLSSTHDNILLIPKYSIRETCGQMSQTMETESSFMPDKPSGLLAQQVAEKSCITEMI